MSGAVVRNKDPDNEDPDNEDRENAFELPDCYRHVGSWDRARSPSAEAASIQDRTQQMREYSRRYQLDHQVVAASLASLHSDPELVAAVAGVGFSDLDTLTPLQAAVVEVAAHRWGRADQLMVVLWGATRGPAFALAAVIEYCRMASPGYGSFVAPAAQAADLFQHWAKALELSELLRSAPDAEYSEAEAIAERWRGVEPSGLTRALTSFLFPERTDWFRADLVAADRGLLPFEALLPSVATADQAAALSEKFRGRTDWQWDGNVAIELAFLRLAGSEALPFLLSWCDAGHVCPPPVKGRPQPCGVHERCLDTIARIPTDAAMTALAERIDREGVHAYLQAAIKRFPSRALRILAGLHQSEEIARLLTMLVLSDRAFAGAEARQLDADGRERIEALLGADASAGGPVTLPEVLVAPPWRDKKRKRVKPIVVEGLEPPQDPGTAWLPGERDRWLTAHGAGWVPEQGWESVWSKLTKSADDAESADNDDSSDSSDSNDDGNDSSDGNDGNDNPVDLSRRNYLLALYFAAYAPEEFVRPHLDTWQPPLRLVHNRARTFIARYELLALPSVLAMARLPAQRAQLLQPFVSPEIAAIMADALVRLRSARGQAADWLRRHPEAAVRCLVPSAVGKPGRVRQNAVAALRFIEADEVDVVAIAQASYGEDVAAATKAVLADRGLEAYPRTIPQAPLWARAEVLPAIRLKDDKAVLPHSAAQAVVEMLMFAKADAPYPGLEIVTEVCGTSSLAGFALALYEAWEQAGAPEQEVWAFRALGRLGDETTVARLRQLTGLWYAQSRTRQVEESFDALAAIGGDRALAVLHTFAGKAWSARTKRRAQAKFDDVAQTLDLTADQLADRVVPTSGLAAAQSTVRLDYGRRSFTLSFDESLRPVVTDETGAPLKTLPKPGKLDDPELSAAAYEKFSTLRTEARVVAIEQIKRLEQAMTGGRRWSRRDFAGYLVPHPLLQRLVRRLVWGVYAEDGSMPGSFRVAEDLSFADIDDAHYEVPEGGLIGVAHPADLGNALQRWLAVFADYEILQPFDQLLRPPLELTAQEHDGYRLVRPYISPDARPGSHELGEVRSLPMKFEDLATSRGWRRGPIGEDRLWHRLLRPVGVGRHVVMELVPGLEAGAPMESPYQAISAVWVSAGGEHPEFEKHALPWSELDPAAVSRILRDLEALG
ncbi:DUF4132 domain-containing protein [Catenulispora sp. NF23]|uniref:DUF4132 domain-containing protein n=1 Tax=Catenulispora pinistramenti TaxID=2705254 RepID=UPI001BAC47D1|nr:DUF4132 domain-containing protein [Catenulispora pinistramenti]MBS2536022.1 DUF4132 domain-containing protein [Catenulispora pinistramenti]